nr:MAG TPA: hypothetical protein [Caudoviricetes sp.]
MTRVGDRHGCEPSEMEPQIFGAVRHAEGGPAR